MALLVSQAARWTATVVFPTPPLVFAITIIMGRT